VPSNRVGCQIVPSGSHPLILWPAKTPPNLDHMQLVAKDIEQVMLLLLALLTLAAGQTGVAAEVASGGLGRAPVARVPAAVTNFTQKRSVAAVRPTPTRVPRPAPRPVVQPKSPVPRAKPATVKRSGPSKHVSSSSAADEVAALLAIKRVLDPTGTTLTDWQPGSSTACEWLPVKIPPAIQCNPSNRVTEISIMGLDGASPLKLTGRLPSSALLRRLPFLERIQIFQTTLRGPLPPDWSLLKQLRQIELMYNALTGGCEALADTCTVEELQHRVAVWWCGCLHCARDSPFSRHACCCPHLPCV
jgi:hypothetical protein